MEFNDQLNAYIARLGCTARELAECSGLSAATVSRYRSGERMPDRAQLAALCRGIAALAAQKGQEGFAAPEVERTLLVLCSEKPELDSETLRSNLNTLLTVLSINVSELARGISYDASHISRIRSGQRKPADASNFVREVAGFVARRYRSEGALAIVAELTGRPAGELADESACFEALRDWLTNGTGGMGGGADYTFAFLKKLDAFDINQYIRAIHFDELKVPSVPFQLPTAKSYFGIKQMRESELDFLKATVLGKSAESVILYSDMPMEEMVKDADFAKQWMFGMAMMLKKGLHLHQIHNIDRSYHEMMLGLESWIPLYMTGQVSPYYLKGMQNNVFLHSLKVSGSAAHTGMAIAGSHANGKYYLTKQKDEVTFYRKMAEDLLKKASPLMEIYREESHRELTAFLLADAKVPGPRRCLLSAPPLYTISEEALTAFLQARALPQADVQRIIRQAATQREYIETVLTHSTVQDEVPVLSRGEFEKFPPALSLAGLFYEKDLCYTYEEYTDHLRQTRAFAGSHPRYTVCETNQNAFRNIEIIMHEGEWAMISKGKAPAIHFVIRHPKLRSAIENMVVPIVEA